MTAIELYEEIKKGKHFNIIDVRDIERYNHFHLEGARSIEKGDIMANFTNYINKDQKYYITCNGGNSAGMIAKMLQSEGYDVESLIGGMNELLKYLDGTNH